MKTKPLAETTFTRNKFEMVQFLDHYGAPCTLQASSLAHYTQPGISAVWLGLDAAHPAKVMARDAAKVGINTMRVNGWINYPVPPEVSVATRMHLTREQVASLILHLQSWLDHDTFTFTKPPRPKKKIARR